MIVRMGWVDQMTFKLLFDVNFGVQKGKKVSGSDSMRFVYITSHVV